MNLWHEVQCEVTSKRAEAGQMAAVRTRVKNWERATTTHDA